jgi:hypothetical protein
MLFEKAFGVAINFNFDHSFSKNKPQGQFEFIINEKLYFAEILLRQRLQYAKKKFVLKVKN